MAETEQELKLALMRAEIANKEADTRLKDEQRRWEPWKAMSAAFGAGAAVAASLLALGAWIGAHFHG